MNRGPGEKSVGSEGTAEAAVRRASSFQVFGTGSASIDSLIGGYRGGTLTMMFGRSNSGKTQLAMQAAMVCARAKGAALFIDTEGSFRPERVEEMATARGWGPEEILNRIVYVRSDSVSEQMEAVRRMNVRGATASAALVVIDTLTRNFSLEFPGRSNVSSRQGALGVHLSEMARDAYLSGRAYLLTNRVTFGTVQDVGIGGKTVEQLVGRSVALQKEGDRVKASVAGSGGVVYARMGKTGVE